MEHLVDQNIFEQSASDPYKTVEDQSPAGSDSLVTLRSEVNQNNSEEKEQEDREWKREKERERIFKGSNCLVTTALLKSWSLKPTAKNFAILKGMGLKLTSSLLRKKSNFSIVGAYPKTKEKIINTYGN